MRIMPDWKNLKNCTDINILNSDFCTQMHFYKCYYGRCEKGFVVFSFCFSPITRRAFTFSAALSFCLKQGL